MKQRRTNVSAKVRTEIYEGIVVLAVNKNKTISATTELILERGLKTFKKKKVSTKLVKTLSQW